VTDLRFSEPEFDDGALANPVETIETLSNLGGKIPQSILSQRQFTIRICGVECRLVAVDQFRHTLLQSRKARLEFVLSIKPPV